MITRECKILEVQCPNCRNVFSPGLDPTAAHLAKMNIDAELKVQVKQSNAAKDAELVRQKNLREVVKGASKTRRELVKAQEAAQRDLLKMQGAAQHGVPADPVLMATLRDLISELTNLASQHGASP